MKLEPAKCPQCGSIINVNPKDEAAVCEACGTPFIVEKAINSYNIENVEIENATINIDKRKKSFSESAFEYLEKATIQSHEERKANIDLIKQNLPLFIGLMIFILLIPVIANFLHALL